MKNLFITLFILLSSTTIFPQNITAKLIDIKTKNPIQYATIKTGEHSGVISNEEGYFSFNPENSKDQTVSISCLGYQNKTLHIEDFKALKNVIALEEAINQLSEVYISNKIPNADSIISKVNRNLSHNYEMNLNKYNIFYRTTDYVDFKNLNFEIEKASHVNSQNLDKANKGLDSLSRQITTSNIIQFSDFKGELFSLNQDSTKLIVNKATKLLDHKSDFSNEKVQNKAQDLLLKYLDTTKTYKVKTGLFKVEDSLSLKNEEFKNDKPNEHEVSQLKSATSSLLYKSLFHKNSFLKTILDSNLYEYTFIDILYNNDELTYIINYKPRKGKAKFTGQLYISDASYAVTKVDYKYYNSRHGGKLNLRLILGVKFIENVSEGIYIYQKNSENKYHPKYIKRIKGSYFYVNRNFKLIENSKNKNKIGFGFKFEGDSRNKEELLFTSVNDISLKDFAALNQEKIASFKMLKAFEKDTWQNEETLEPLQEMKVFGDLE